MTQAFSIRELITPEMEAARGRWSDEREVSEPVTGTDIRRWAIAVSWPETPPRLFWDPGYAATTRWGGIVAPEDFNPFAWPVHRRERGVAASKNGLAIDLQGVPIPHRRGPVPAEALHRVGGMNAGRADEFGARIRPGDIVSSRHRLHDWREEETRLGPTLFVRSEIEWTNQEGAMVRRRLQSALRYFADAATSRESSGGDSTRARARTSDIPAWSRATGLETWNRFAAVNDEFVDIHMDDAAGIRAGNPDGAFGMGNLRYAYIINALRDWLGDGMELRQIECQFRALNKKGDRLTVEGSIRSETSGGGMRLLSLDIDVTNQDGASTAPGTATVAVPAE